jgi:hypothetical protein
MAIHKVSGMRGWTDIGSDVSWDDYGGKWARRAHDGSWYVIEFTNMYDACGEGECKRDGQAQYVCEVSRVDLADLNAEQIASALRCVGLRQNAGYIYGDGGDEIACQATDAKRFECVLVEACASYGCKQPLDSFSGDMRPANVRADARRAAETLMRDASALEAELDRPVNRMGSTAREYARGEILPALGRMADDNPTKQIMGKMIGMPTLGGGTFGEK